MENVHWKFNCWILFWNVVIPFVLITEDISIECLHKKSMFANNEDNKIDKLEDGLLWAECKVLKWSMSNVPFKYRKSFLSSFLCVIFFSSDFSDKFFFISVSICFCLFCFSLQSHTIYHQWIKCAFVKRFECFEHFTRLSFPSKFI